MSNRSIELEATLRLALEALGKAIRYGSFHGADWAFNEIESSITAIKEALSTKCVAQRPSRSDIKPLTIDQIASIAIDRSKPDGIIAFVRAIEAAHGIKE